MSFASRFRERREALGLRQGDVAERLGVTAGAIANYENGVSNPKADILYGVFDALKCDANYLFQDEMSALDEKAITWAEPIAKAYAESPTTTQEMVCKMLDIKYIQPPATNVPDDSAVRVFRAARSKEGTKGQTVEMPNSRLEKLRKAKPAEEI